MSEQTELKPDPTCRKCDGTGWKRPYEYRAPGGFECLKSDPCDCRRPQAGAAGEAVAWICREKLPNGGRGPNTIITGATVMLGYEGVQPLYAAPLVPPTPAGAVTQPAQGEVTEPRGCPTPGAYSCISPQPAQDAGGLAGRLNRIADQMERFIGPPEMAPGPDADDLREAAARIEADAAALTELKEERDELQQLFDMRWEADMRAVKRWREANPGNDLVLPDHADLVVWLLETRP